MRNWFVFGKYDSRNFGVYISGKHTFRAPNRTYKNYVVPGRDGDLLGSSTRLENTKLTYPAFVYTNYKKNVENLRSALLSTIGYARLQDTYHPDEYRLAVYKGGLNPDTVDWNGAGEFNIEFEVKPQRYLTEGETVVTLTAAGKLMNPTMFASQPLLRVYGYGTVGVGSETITISQHNHAYIDIDCEMMDCFYGAVNCNSLVSFSGTDFPTLPPGVVDISKGSNVTKIEITPRWWRT